MDGSRVFDSVFSPSAGNRGEARFVDLHEHDKWVGAALVGRTRKGLAKLVGPKNTWAKVAAILCFAAILFLTFAKGRFKRQCGYLHIHFGVLNF
jgi:hypothetical protein